MGLMGPMGLMGNGTDATDGTDATKGDRSYRSYRSYRSHSPFSLLLRRTNGLLHALLPPRPVSGPGPVADIVLVRTRQPVP